MKRYTQNLIPCITLLLATLLLSFQCTTQSGAPEARIETNKQALSIREIPTDISWSQRMSLSVMKRAPEAWMNDFSTSPQWTYTHGLLFGAMLKAGITYKDDRYFDYVKAYGDTMIRNDGSIRDYDITAFNIDNIALGPVMIHLFEETGEDRFKKAFYTLNKQLHWQPQTTDGGYWHKLRYPWQMWLDGLFMGEPFQTEFAAKYGQPELFDNIVEQFVLAEEHTRDPETGLLYHGWDESHLQSWADKETGCSPHFWARAIGWYVMGIVDVLEYLPKDHPGHEQLITILDRTLSAVVKVQDPETATWWQIMNHPNREGNYLESTASCMFTYAILKGVNEGYLDTSYKDLGKKSYEGLLNTFIKVDENDGEVHLTKCCSVAGLGGNPYRDGSYEYYIGEKIRDNDSKGMGPFILASLEIERMQK